MPDCPTSDLAPGGRRSRRPLAAAAAIGLAAGLTLLLAAPALAQHQDTHGTDRDVQGAMHDDAHAADHGHGHAADHGHGHAADHGHGHGDPTAHYNWTDLGYKDKDVQGGTLEEGEEQMSPPFALMLVNFGIVLFILWWKVRPLIQRYVRGRHENIKGALEEAAKLRDDAKRKLDQYTEQLEKAEKEIDDMVAQIRASAEAEKKRMLADAEAQAEALKKDAESRIAAELERARAELEREVVAAAVAVAEELIRDKATKDDQVKLVDGFISDMNQQAEGAQTGAPS